MVDIDCVSHDVPGVGIVTFATDSEAADSYTASVREAFRAEPPVTYTVSRLSPHDKFIDIGANIGVYALPAAKVGARVFAVEALPSNYFLLSIAAEKNNFTNLQVLNAAAYDRTCIVQIHGESAWGTIVEGVDGQEVLAMRMDELIARHGFDDARLLKLDVEGCELKALHGLDNFISNANELELIIEVNEPACRRAGYKGNELLLYLEKKGFKLFAFADSTLSPRRAEEFRESYCMDFLAVKSGRDWSPPAGFAIEPSSRQDILQLVKVMLLHDNAVCGEYMLDAIESAPQWVVQDADILALLAVAKERLRKGQESKTIAAAPAPPAVVERVHKKLAIVASDSKLCGISSYARQLSKNLEAVFDIVYVPLDQTIMRDSSLSGKKLAEKVIDASLDLIKTCDWVNIHLEPGTFGPSKNEITARFQQLVEASPKLIVTFHSMARPHPPQTIIRLANVIGGRIGRYLHTYAAQRMCSDEMWTELLDTLKRYEETHELFLLTHTPGDKRFLEQQLGFKRVDDHPLCYLTKTNSRALKQNSNVQEYRAEVLRTRMRLVGSGSASTSGSVARSISTSSNGNGYSNGKSVTKRPEALQRTKLVGAFGFISAYKGLLCAVKAMPLLPEDYTLLIAGSIHPFNHIDYKEGDDHLLAIQELIEKEGLQQRVIFKPSAATDEEFMESIDAVDIVVCSYLEYGQSGSGPAQLAIELDKPLICTKTRAFMQLAEYYPGRINLVDVGNHMHLAQTIQQIAAGDCVRATAPMPYSVETCTELYRKVVQS